MFKVNRPSYNQCTKQDMTTTGEGNDIIIIIIPLFISLSRAVSHQSTKKSHISWEFTFN